MSKPKIQNQTSKFWEFTNAAGSKKGDLYLYGAISSSNYGGWWGETDDITPAGFREDLEALGNIDELNVHIFSEGGSVFAGTAIYAMLKQHKANINVYVEGLAASIASVIAMAGDNIYMSKTAMMMVHNPMEVLFGTFNSRDLLQFAHALDKIQTPIVEAYKEKSGLSDEEVIKLLDGEGGEGTWMSADEAIEKGLADGVIPDEMTLEPVNVVSQGKYTYRGHTIDLTKYPNAPNLEGVKNNIKEVKSVTGKTSTTVADPPTEGQPDTALAGEGAVMEPVAGAQGATGATGATEGPVAEFERGVQVERERVSALDAMAAAAPECAEIVARAKTEGLSELETSRQIFARLAEDKKSAPQNAGATIYQALIADAGVIPPLGAMAPTQPEDYKAKAKEITERINKMRSVN